MTVSKFYIALILVPLSLFFAILYLPNFINWNGYKTVIRVAIFNTSGCHLSIDGDLSVNLFPNAEIILNDIRLTSDSEVGAPSLMSIKYIHADISLKKLLMGEIKINHMALYSPVLLIPVGQQKICDRNAPGMDILAEDNNKYFDNILNNKTIISINKIAVKNAAFMLKPPQSSQSSSVNQTDNLKINITDANFEIEYKSPKATASIKGSIKANNIPIDIDFLISNINKKGKMPAISANLIFPEIKSKMVINGVMSQSIENIILLKGAFKGNIAFSSKNPYLIFNNSLRQNDVNTENYQLNFTSGLQATSRYISLNNYNLEIGKMRGTGAANINFDGRPNIDIFYNMQMMDLDNILSDMPDIINNDINGEDNKNGKIYNIILDKITKKFNADISLDVTISTLKYANGIIGEIGFHALFGDGSLTLDNATALFPGQSHISLFGFMENKQNIPYFDGKLSIQSDNLKQFLKWSKIANITTKTSRLRNLSYDSNISISFNKLEFTDINAALDSSNLTGQAHIYLDKETPLITTKLSVDRINLDAYSDILKNIYHLNSRNIDDKINLIEFDTDIKIDIKKITLLNKNATNIISDISFKNSNLNINKLTFSRFLSIDGNIFGKIDNIFKQPSIDLNINAVFDDISTSISSFDEINQNKLAIYIAEFTRKIGKINSNISLNRSLNEAMIDLNMRTAEKSILLNGILYNNQNSIMLSIKNSEYNNGNFKLQNINGILSSNNNEIIKLTDINANLANGKLYLSEANLIKDVSNSLILTAKGSFNYLVAKNNNINLKNITTRKEPININFSMSSRSKKLSDIGNNIKIKGKINDKINGNISIEKILNHINKSIAIKNLKILNNFTPQHFSNENAP